MPEVQPSPSPSRPVVVYDGDCRFCRFWILRCRAQTGEKVAYHPYQAVHEHFPEVGEGGFENAVYFFDAPRTGEEQGATFSGTDALFRLLARYGRPVGRLLARTAIACPGVMPLGRRCYPLVANHRQRWSRLTTLLWGRGEEAGEPPTYHLGSWFFLRLLGIILMIAFGSLLWQVRGLIGEKGVLPASEFLAAVGEQVSEGAFRQFPTLFWLGASDPLLIGGCLLGVLLGLAVFAGWHAGPALLGAWALYLSLCVAGQTFMNFQWDALLLETALLAAFLVPLHARRALRKGNLANRLSRWLLLFLLLRLMVESAAVKIISGDPAWASLTALSFHFETQPLPLATAWWAHQLPSGFLKVATLGMFAIEFLAPLTLLGPRRLRVIGFWAMVSLQIGIAATGNYTFFNLLSASLCLLMLDDYLWPQKCRRLLGMPPRLPAGEDPARPLPPARPSAVAFGPVHLLCFAPIAIASLLIGTKGLLETTIPLLPEKKAWQAPATLQQFADTLAPLRSFNRYGLFAVMTQKRPEIILEGSADGTDWREYRFRWKPGDPLAAPRLVAPHQPRLDWQMWFAALGSAERNGWLLNLMGRLLQGEPTVLALLGPNPFPEGPPKHLRAVLYQYRFTRSGEGPAWWHREELGLYHPPVSLRPASGSN